MAVGADLEMSVRT
jgi:hypothetical protein